MDKCSRLIEHIEYVEYIYIYRERVYIHSKNGSHTSVMLINLVSPSQTVRLLVRSRHRYSNKVCIKNRDVLQKVLPKLTKYGTVSLKAAVDDRKGDGDIGSTG